MLAGKKFLEENEYSKDILQHNTKRLVTMNDVRATVLSIAKGYYGEKHDTGESYSLYGEKIPAGRTCEDADIPDSY